MNDRMRVEDCLIPTILCHILLIHMEGYGQNTKLDTGTIHTFETATETLRNFVKKRIHNNPALHRRLMRMAQKISDYFVDNGFTTLKSLLTLTAWNDALLKAGGLIIDDEEYIALLLEFGRVIDKGYADMEGFDRQDASALKHVTRIHKIAQQNGYFL